MPAKVYKVEDHYEVRDTEGHLYAKHRNKKAAVKQARAINASAAQSKAKKKTILTDRAPPTRRTGKRYRT